MTIIINGLQVLLCLIVIVMGKSILAFNNVPGVITGVLFYLPLSAYAYYIFTSSRQLTAVEQFQLELEMENRAYLEKQISRIGKEVAKMSHQKLWAESMTYIMQLPGFPGTARQGRCGVITGMTVLAAIGEIQRFGTPQHLASYSGRTGGLD